mgnify:CR=1 FL=1
MHALFFEMRPHPGHLEHYFEHVDRLRPVLARHEGLLFLDRYSSLNEPDLLLSHQLWDSEDAIVAWRADAEHRRSQGAGRRIHFADYRIRVGARVRHWQAGETKFSTKVDAASDCSHVLALYGTQPVKEPGFESFASVNRKGRFISLATTGDLAAADSALRTLADAPAVEEAAAYSIRRDYGQFDRVQAPQ